ncbi:hypothetical protein MEG1DRAFT_03557 [Photorhabdus temperata subsp. temperata Meg1]|uniref:Uncharacterized protein n=1 Tax=Photorhabdus temperata subsp. temperata Meg1 TaxID=1393735 RepID=A0A081RT42_PHOTE|nr:hypothetical protein MEG1DRAFT_03557 [Photorhabdus temperata subsp. temperata Meg1]
MKLIMTKQNNQAAIASEGYSLLETSDKLSGEGMDNVLKYGDTVKILNCILMFF